MMQSKSHKKLFLSLAAVILVCFITFAAFMVTKAEEDKTLVTKEELYTVLKDAGITDPVLPQVFFEDGNEIYLFGDEAHETGLKSVEFDVYMKGYNFTAAVIVEKSMDETIKEFAERKVVSNYRNVKDYIVEDTYVLHFYDQHGTYITYVDNSIEYEISIIDCNSEMGIKIIETIK